LATATLVQDQLPSGVRVRDLGERHLKDLARPEHVFQLLVPDLPSEFPPLRALETWPNNLPAQLTSFVGRAQECAAVAELLASQRLVTLTGPGGTGKTRLALHVAADRLEQFSNGVWLVELAPLADPLLVPLAVASVLGLREEAGRPLLTVLTDYLRTRTLLLLLDNCEHLLDACAQLAETLLRSCPQLRILASSREALGVAGEAPFRVPPLRTPDPRQLPELEAFAQYEAVRLFTERATSVLSSFRVTSENMAALAHVCSRLDGIPLALELAAARVNVLRVEQIAARLNDRVRLLTGASRSAVPRQQTLRALIDWSYDLLSAPEQQVLRHLAVFAGGWTLGAAETVCAGEGLEQERVLDVLSRLVDKSLVQAERVLGQEARYGLLETIRQYAVERLAASGAADTIRRRHAAHYLALAEEARRWIGRREQGVWLDRLDLEHDNLRAALGWALGGGAAEVGARIALALAGHDWSSFWRLRGHGSEALRWLERVAEQPNQLTPSQQAWALLLVDFFREGLNGISWDQLFAVSDQALALFREGGDRAGIAWAIEI
jgi:predicted ATPase